MNHTIKGIILVVAITSMLVLGTASMFPIMQNSFAHKKSDFKGADPNTNTNTNTNSADSSSSSNATAENTNNITNSATASSNQNQNACAIALTCPQGSTTVTPPSADPCPHSPYTDFSGGLCQNGAPTSTCNPSTIDRQPATPTDGTCRATQDGGNPIDFFDSCNAAGGTIAGKEIVCIFPSTPSSTAVICAALTNTQISAIGPNENNKCTGMFEKNNEANRLACEAAGGIYTVDNINNTCTGYDATQNCPPPEGSTQTPTVVNGRCTIQPGPT